MYKKLYRKYVPCYLKNVLHHFVLAPVVNTISGRKERKLRRDLRKKIVLFYEEEANKRLFPEYYYEAAQWIKRNRFATFPYDFIYEYRKKKIPLFKCKETGLSYVLHEGKRLYFPRNFYHDDCVGYYKRLLIEQDLRSPHKYYCDCFAERKNWTLLDIGAAEGIFALSRVDDVDKIYLFEYDDLWLEALEATFRPYREKVQIVNKFVSNEDDEINITLDSFLSDKSFENVYVKMDIEGAELLALEGIGQLIGKNDKLVFSVCAYHVDGAGDEITDFLEKNGYEFSYTSGVMTMGKEAPYFRKGMVYSYKSNNQ
jgi:hypothetical protein